MQENPQQVAFPGFLHWDAIYNFISCLDFPKRLILIFRFENKKTVKVIVGTRTPTSNKSQTYHENFICINSRLFMRTLTLI